MVKKSELALLAVMTSIQVGFLSFAVWMAAL
jgi:hypothetical protein